MELLTEDEQAAWTILSTAVAHQLDFSLNLQFPTDILERAAAFEARIWRALEQLAGQDLIPRGEEGLGVECVGDVREVPELQGHSYQHLLVPLPVMLGGCGTAACAKHGILNGRQERPQPGMNYKVLFVFMSCLLYPFLFWFGFGYIIIICQFCSGALHAGPALQGNY